MSSLNTLSPILILPDEMNLLPYEFDQSAILSNFPPMDFCEYAGETPGGFQRFKCARDGSEFNLISAWLIRKEEDLIWKSCDELLARTIKEAAQTMRGIYGFEVLSLQLGDSIRTFQWDKLRQLIVNHARTLQTGEEKLLRYTSFFGILKKRVPEDWGKIDYRQPVMVFSKPAELDLLVKKMIKDGEAAGGDFEASIQDLSLEPIFKFGHEDQTARMEKTLKAVQAKGKLPCISIADSRNWIEFGEQFGLREHV